ncbi:transporter substrate-binding domain-containing protein [Oxalobacteraceae bacterium]|nr:transporter substrate-binding domain-containing protein [Oxalobacteraceae bacterium]
MTRKRYFLTGDKLAAGALALALAAAPAARAGCSREILVPVSSSGANVVINQDTVNGVYPDLLRSLGAKYGCQFVFPVVPRARQVAMFEAGKADLLIPATRTPTRDQIALHVPMIGSRAMLISVAGSRPAISNAHELLERRDLRVAVVRGFDYGEPYMALVKELEHQGRLFIEVDVTAVARLLQAGSADLTIMGPSILAGAIKRDKRVVGLIDKLRLEPIPELPWNYSGAYISKLALKAEDQEFLRELLEKAARTGVVYEGYQRYYPPAILNDSVRPR